jgi:membrane-associated phospholipid phosphatase
VREALENIDSIDQTEVTLLRRRSAKPIKFLQARLSPAGFLGLYLTLGTFALIGATWLFGGIAEDVVNGDPLTVVDARFTAWLHAHTLEPLTTLMLLVTAVHATLGVSIMTLAVLAWLLRRRLYYWALTVMLSVFGGMLLNFLLKNIFQRPRPHFTSPILPLITYSFPSGHTMMATVFYGSLCALAVARMRGWQSRSLAISIAVFMVAVVGFSRIYLGVHYLSDVLGAIAEGLAWLALCLTTVEMLRRGRSAMTRAKSPANVAETRSPHWYGDEQFRP